MSWYENPPYYLTAYGLALKRGFHGSEQDWLDSLNAYGVAVKNGYEGTIDDWLQDLTAYGQAKAEGFTGTRAEWLASLQGVTFTPYLKEDGTFGFTNDRGLPNPEPVNLYELALGGIGRILSFVIPSGEWLEDPEKVNGYGVYFDLCHSRISSAMVPNVVLEEASLAVAGEAGMCTTAESFAGYVRIKCVERPTGEIRLTLVLSALNTPDSTVVEYELPTAGPNVLGGIKSSDSVTVDADGTAHAIAKVSDENLASDEEVEDMLNDIFGE